MRDFQQFKHCRWCGKVYFKHQPYGRDGFCCRAHKQAHYRACRKYVTANSDRLPDRKNAGKKR